MTELSGSDPPTPPVLGGAGPAGAPFPSGPGCLRLFFSTWFGEFGKKGERESAGLLCGPQPLGFPPGRSPAPCFTGQESAASEGAVRPGRGAHPHRPRGPAVPAPPAARTPRGASSPDPVRLRCGAARSGPSHPRDVCPLPEVPAGRGCVPGPLASAPPRRVPGTLPAVLSVPLCLALGTNWGSRPPGPRAGCPGGWLPLCLERGLPTRTPRGVSELARRSPAPPRRVLETTRHPTSRPRVSGRPAARRAGGARACPEGGLPGRWCPRRSCCPARCPLPGRFPPERGLSRSPEADAEA